MTDILREVGNIARALDYISNVEFKEINLNKGQYIYLNRIYEIPGIINDDLARLVKSDRTAVAKAVKHLEQDDLVYKSSAISNKKIRHLYVTTKGEKLYQHLQQEEKRSQKQALTGLTLNEQEELARLLKKVSTNVAQDWEFIRQGNKRTY